MAQSHKSSSSSRGGKSSGRSNGTASGAQSRSRRSGSSTGAGTRSSGRSSSEFENEDLSMSDREQFDSESEWNRPSESSRRGSSSTSRFNEDQFNYGSQGRGSRSPESSSGRYYDFYKFRY